MSGAFRLSIVIPVFNAAGTIGSLVEELIRELGDRYDLEIVLVDDGSPDASAAACRALAERHGEVLFLALARNFGEHNAVMAGLNHCTGRAAVIMDDDFQNPPAEVGKLVDALGQGFDVVFARYDRKHHGWFRNLGSRFQNAVATAMLHKPRDLYLSSFKALDRFLIDEIVKYRGPFPYIDGLVLRTTNRLAVVDVEHHPRREGQSNYTMRKLVRLWLAAFTNFSILPLRVATVLGLGCAAAGMVAAVLFALERVVDPTLPVGWASIMCTVLLLSGVQLVALGTIGEYLGRLFLQENAAPQFVVRERVEKGA